MERAEALTTSRRSAMPETMATSQTVPTTLRHATQQWLWITGSGSPLKRNLAHTTYNRTSITHRDIPATQRRTRP